ncbi:probable purine permease 11 [Humulus lupulus]|uniref:probable purine permease 11 n=1 Tax=Humulus lupulus TaxID=3486 RepID=UPI002B404B43|nr:probable purine permease 11 [Humulus lupulus]
MEPVRELQLQTRVEDHGHGQNPNTDISMPSATYRFSLPKLIHYKWWIRVMIYIVFIIAGQSAATLLGRLYYDKGGNSKWIATIVQSAGFPILIPLLLFFSSPIKPTRTQPNKVKLSSLALLYVFFGLILTLDNLLYSYGLLYLPVSTYSLLCATQLAFNALFSFFLNSQNFTPFILNSLVLLTTSASLLALNADSDEDSSTKISKRKYVIGFLTTLGASATYSLYLSLVQLSFQKIIRAETFSSVLNMQIYPSFVASCGCIVGLFASGEWRGLGKEMKEYQESKVSYVMTLIWIALTWQICSVGLLGLIFEVSSLFSNVISTLALPVIPILAVIFFHDKMNGLKVIAMVLAIWGFLSYIYQHYLDDLKHKADKSNSSDSEIISGRTV